MDKHGLTIRARPGLTLIEVVAALTLIGTTAVAVLVAQSQAIAQINRSRHRELAAELAHRLVIQWHMEDVSLRDPDQGRWPDHPDWSWQRRAKTERVKLDGDLAMADPLLIHVQLTIVREPMGELPVEVYTVDWLEPPEQTTP